jgi:hypothetical protein
VHLHIDVDAETERFQYKAIFPGERITLRHTDSITFRSKYPFTIQFDGGSPFVPNDKSFIAHLDSGEWIIPLHVRDSADPGSYPYAVRMTTLGRTFEHEGERVHVLLSDPEIILEQF